MQTGGMINAHIRAELRAGIWIVLMFSLIMILIALNNTTQTTHASFFCIFTFIGAIMIYLKTNHNLGLQIHAFITENTPPLSLAAFLGGAAIGGAIAPSIPPFSTNY